MALPQSVIDEILGKIRLGQFRPAVQFRLRMALGMGGQQAYRRVLAGTTLAKATVERETTGPLPNAGGSLSMGGREDPERLRKRLRRLALAMQDGRDVYGAATLGNTGLLAR